MVNEPPQLPPVSVTPTRTSGLAIASFVLGLLSCPFTVFASIPGLICGIMGLRRISQSEKGGPGPRLTGRGLATTGITLSAVMTLLFPLAIAVLLPAMMAARNAARTMPLMNNLKQISLAAAMAEQQVGFFPGDIIDGEANALLSWRVAILPFLGEEEAKLFKEFHLDEPWDSEHNKPLLSRMPAVYASLDKPSENGLTDVVHPVNDGAAFCKVDSVSSLNDEDTAGVSGVKGSSIPDGLSKTVFVMILPFFETPWTQPGDFAGDPVPLFSTLSNNGQPSVVLGTGDGAVYRVSTGIEPKAIRAIFSRDAGDMVPPDTF